MKIENCPENKEKCPDCYTCELDQPKLTVSM